MRKSASNLQEIKAKKVAALYLRVSTEQQKDLGSSVAMQKEDLTNLAKSNRMETEVYDDSGKSGKDLERPDFKRMMEDVRAGKLSAIYVWKFDRISRKLLDFLQIVEELDKYGVALISKSENVDTSTTIGRLILNILMSFAQAEREMIVDRVTSVMYNRAKNCKWNGGPPPFGYKMADIKRDEATHKPLPGQDNFPVPDPIEAPKVLRIFQLYAQEKSLNRLAKALEAEGIVGRAGKAITPHHLGRMIVKQFYIGNYEYNRSVYRGGRSNENNETVCVEGSHQAIIPKELFYECQRIRKSNRNFDRECGQKCRRTENHIFGHIARCTRCGRVLNANYIPSRTRPRSIGLSRYGCISRYDFSVHCDARKTASEIQFLPWMFKFISRIMYASNHAAEFGSYKSLQDFLLKDIFTGCIGIEEIKEIYTIVRSHIKPEDLVFDDENKYAVNNASVIADLQQQIKKKERALERLKLVLFSDEDFMDPAEYAKTVKDIKADIAKLEGQIEALNVTGEAIGDDNVIAKGGQLVLMNRLEELDADYSGYDLVDHIGKKNLYAFFHTIISRLELDEHDVAKIVFTNGITCTFVYPQK